MDASDIIQRKQRCHADRTTVQQIWDAIERYIAPYRGRFFEDESSEHQIDWNRPWVFDSTAPHASQDLAAFIHSQLTSFTSQWFAFQFRDRDLRDDREAMIWLEELEDRVFRSLEESNFNLEASETYQDLVDFGTAFICEEVERDDRDKYTGLNFKTVPIKEAFFEQNHKGEVEIFYRELMWTALQIVTKFGREGLDENILEAADNGDNRKYKLIFCVYRRPEISLSVTRKHRVLAPENRPFGFKYVLEDSGEELGEEGGYYEMPVFVPRWRKTSSSMWGNSPAMVALPDVMTVNRVTSLTLSAAEKALDPPLWVTERGVVSDMELEAAGVTVVRNADSLGLMPIGANFDVSNIERAQLQESIKRYFHVDQIMLPPMQGTPATATEIQMRWAQVERIFGPTFGRLKTDYLDKILERTLNILWREGQLPEMPESLQGAEGALDIEYTGPLARSQRQSDVTSIERWVQFVLQLAQANPEVMDVVDWDALPRTDGTMIGVPPELMKSKEDVAKIREERKQMQQAQMQAEMQNTQADTADKMAGAEQKLDGMGGEA